MNVGQQRVRVRSLWVEVEGVLDAPFGFIQILLSVIRRREEKVQAGIFSGIVVPIPRVAARWPGIFRFGRPPSSTPPEPIRNPGRF